MFCLTVVFCTAVIATSGRIVLIEDDSGNTQYYLNLHNNTDNCTNGLPNYRFYPYNCTKYLGCENGKLDVFDCPRNLFWNEEIKACDLEEKTDCSHIIPAVPDCKNTTERYFACPYDCGEFYECYNKTAYLMTCPPKTLWNDKIKECDDENKVDCSEIIPTSTSSSPTDSPTTFPTTNSTVSSSVTTTTGSTVTTSDVPSPTTSSTSPEPTPAPGVICPPGVRFLPDPSSCNKFYECSNGIAHEKECDTGLDWDPVINTCVGPGFVNCSWVTPEKYSATTNLYYL